MINFYLQRWVWETVKSNVELSLGKLRIEKIFYCVRPCIECFTFVIRDIVEWFYDQKLPGGFFIWIFSVLQVQYEFGCSYPKTLEKTADEIITPLAQGHTANKWKEVREKIPELMLYPLSSMTTLCIRIWTNYPMKLVIVFLFDRQGNWSSSCLRILCRMTKLANVRDKIPTQIFPILKLLFFPFY